STRGEDGDPLDLLVLMEQPAFAGCLVPVRLIGVLEAEQSEDGEASRNDRLIGAADESRKYGDLKKLGDVEPHLLHEIEHFFVSYNQERGRKFEVTGRGGRQKARRLVQAAEKRFRREND